MSVQATSWVWDHSQAEGNARLVLLAIADAANKEGRKSCQSAKTIGDMCRISGRTVRRHVNELLEAGEISLDGKDGIYQTNVYSFPGMTKPLGQNSDLGQNDTPVSSDQPLGQNEGVVRTELCPPTPLPQDTYVSTPEGGAGKSVATRATRLSEGWAPPQKHLDKIKSKYPTLDLDTEHMKFTNYWLSKSGKDATKTDWGRTWENWMIRASEYKAKSSRYADNTERMDEGQTMLSRASQLSQQVKEIGA